MIVILKYLNLFTSLFERVEDLMNENRPGGWLEMDKIILLHWVSLICVNSNNVNYQELISK